MSNFLKKYRWGCFGLALFTIIVLIVFAPVLATYSGLNAPDSPPYFAWPWRTHKLLDMLASGAFTPHALYWLLLKPLHAHELTYICDSLVLALGLVFYLRTQRIHPLAAWFGGLALAFSGYTFTLFSAGHRGYFHMFSCAVWSFGLIARGFETRKLIYFAWLGLVLAWGVPHQPDVLLLAGAVIAAYVLWLTLSRPSRAHAEANSHQSESEKRKLPIEKHPSKILSTLIHTWPRFLVSFAILVLAGFAGIRSAVTTQIVNRDAQISGHKTPTPSQADTTAKSVAERRERWLFATNWSLPPEDMAEFLVPGIFGNDSVQPPYPYWGRLGRPDASLFQKGRMMPNYRQHTVYLGLVPLLLAICAALCRAPRPQVTTQCEANNKNDSDTPALKGSLVDRPFWIAVWVVCLVLAMGRFTPLYRLFYALPYMDYIRAPVKFLHLVELATGVLAGFGMHALLAGEKASQRRLLWLASGAALLCLAGLAFVWIDQPTIAGHIAALGMAPAAEALSGYMTSNLLRATVLAGLFAGVILFARRAKFSHRVVTAAVLLTILAAFDQALVARRYVRALPLEPLYHENAVIKALKKNAAGRVPRVINYATQNTWQDWFSMSLHLHGIRNLMPSADEADSDYEQLFKSLLQDPQRLWRTLRAQAVIIPRTYGEPLVRAGLLRPLLEFELGSGTVRQVQQPGKETLLLAAIANAAATPCFVAEWQGNASADAQLAALNASDSILSDAPRLSEAAPGSAEVSILSERGQPGALETRVKVRATATGLLVFGERPVENLELLLDGEPAPRYTVDAVWPAALVPAGEHEVRLRPPQHPRALLLSTITTLAVLLWSILCFSSKQGVGIPLKSPSL